MSEIRVSLSHKSKVNILYHIATHNNDHIVNEASQTR